MGIIHRILPNVFNDKGALWISSIKKIHNPYFGEKMLKCGEVKETINQIGKDKQGEVEPPVLERL